MPVADLPAIPSGISVFIDANVILYAFLRTSAQAMDLLLRCAREEITGVTSLDVVNDVTHRLMLAEALQKNRITRQNAGALKSRPDIVRELGDYWEYTRRLFSLNLILVGNDEPLLRQGQSIRSRFGLLTKDSLIVAAMDEYEVANLATNDRDFEAVDHLTIFRPGDLPA